jgi:hypothetical protein
MKKEELGIIRDVGIGHRDSPYPCLWFTVYTSEHLASLQVLSWKEAENLIRDTQVYDVKALEGRPCYVETDGNVSRFLRCWKA